MSGKRTMTLNLTVDEMNLLEELSTRCEMSKTAVVRKVIEARIQKGEKLFLEDEIEKKKMELVVL
jgi:predicted DNA-binding protein